MSLPVCKFYSSNASCKYGKNCRYLHQARSQRPPPADTHNPEQKDNHEVISYTSTSSDFLTRHTLEQHTPKNPNGLSVDPKTSKEPSDIKETSFRNNHLESEKHIIDRPLEQIDSTAFTPKVCLHFARGGRCYYGKKCKFSHALSHKVSKQKYNGQGQQLLQKKSVAGRTSDTPSTVQKVDYDKENQDEPSKECDNLNSCYDEKEKKNSLKTDKEQTNVVCLKSKGKTSFKGNNEKRICQFFKSNKCNRGERCRFRHPTDLFNSVEIDLSRQMEGNFVRNYPGKSYDRLGKPANFSERKRAVYSGCKQVFTLNEIDDTSIIQLRREEICTIKRRFPKDKVSAVIDDDEHFSIRIKFIPTDPDWPFDLKIFEMIVAVPGNYPKEMIEISFPKDQDIPETVRRYIEITVGEWLDEKKRQLEDAGKVELVFRPFLKWLDKNIEEITTEALKQFKRQLVAKAAGIEIFSPQQLQEKLRTTSGSTNESDEEGDSSGSLNSTSGSEEEDESNDTDDEFDNNSSIYALNHDPAKKGTEIELRHLQLKENASALFFSKLKIVLQCGRCKNQADLVVHQGKVMSTTCAKCSQNQFVHFRPALIHQFSSTAGYLDVDGCQAFDLILQDCSVHVTCLGCSKETKIEGLVSGQMIDGWCRACNAKFKLATESVKFTQLVPSGVDTSVSKVIEVASTKARKPPKDPAIKEGYPLPEFGTCKHFKHSYRWLRFPCCGKAYPCDVCHDKKEDHEMTFANRMICGHCCKEQNFSASRPCNSCGQHMTKVRSAHWEGGSGCRDKIAMSKNDQQKYRSMNKTMSNHKKKVKSGSSSKKNTKLRHT